MTGKEALSPAKRALLERELLRRRTAAATTIPRRAPGTPVPLSSTQTRMWFLAQWAPDSFTQNAARAMRLRGTLDSGALHAALVSVVERHEVLRTVVEPGPPPTQRLLEGWELPLVEEAVSEPELGARLVDLARERFDLTRDLPIRATLLELGPDDHVLLLRVHHIAGDAHSMTVLWAEVAEVYGATLAGRDPRLPELMVQYGDYTLWQIERLSGPYLEELNRYWGQQLEGTPPLLPLPLDRPRPAVQRNLGRHQLFSVPRDQVDPLLEVARGEGATFYIAMLALFATLLYRRSGADDFVIGSPIANRTLVELDPLIGFFSNTMALRMQLGGNPSFRELLGRTRATATGAYAHQDLPFERLVELVAPPRNPSHHPLFQVNFRAQQAPPARLELPGVSCEPMHVDIGFSRFDLALELELGETSLDGYMEYDTDLFEPATIDGLVADLGELISQIASAPDTPLLELTLERRARAASAGITRRRRPAGADGGAAGSSGTV